MPPPMRKIMKKPSLLWCKKAVDSLAACSIFDCYTFIGDERPDGFDQVMGENNIYDLYEEMKSLEVMQGCAFITVTPGFDDESNVIINGYDAEHACALWDVRNRRIKCGAVIVDVSDKDKNKPTAVNFYTDTDIIEMRVVGGKWQAERHPHYVGRPLMEVLRFDSDLNHPIGNSHITDAIIELEDKANHEVAMAVLQSELYTAPTRWVMGAPDDIFENGRWEAYIGSIFALPKDQDGDKPVTGQYSQGTMDPHISLIRQLASAFAAETLIPISSLLYTEANPASAEAISAHKDELIQKANEMNRRNGVALRNVGLLAVSLMQKKPFNELGDDVKTMAVKWQNPAHPSPSQLADMATKLASVSPTFPMSRVFWELNGFDEVTVNRIMDDTRRFQLQQQAAALMAENNDYQ